MVFTPDFDDLLGLRLEDVLQQLDEDYLLAHLFLCDLSGVRVLLDVECASVLLALQLIQYLLQPREVQVDVLVRVNAQRVGLGLLLAFDESDDAAPRIGDDSYYLRGLLLLQPGLIIIALVLLNDQRRRGEILQTSLVVYVEELGVISLEEHDAVLAVLRKGPLPLFLNGEEVADLL